MRFDEQRDEIADLFAVDPAWRAIADMDVTRLADAILSSAWLDRVSQEVAAQALDEAAAALVVDRVEGSTYSAGLPLVAAEWASAHTERWLRARAASIRSGATS